MIKTLKVMVVLEIQADVYVDDSVREEIADTLQEQIELDELDYTVEESDEEEAG